MTERIILTILVSHFIGDFVLQSHWMSMNKSSSNSALTIHVMLYTLTIWLGMCTALDWQIAFVWAMLNGTAHWITDWCTSRITKKLWQLDKVHWFFLVIGFDQLIHYVTMVMTVVWMSSWI